MTVAVTILVDNHNKGTITKIGTMEGEMIGGGNITLLTLPRGREVATELACTTMNPSLLLEKAHLSL